VTEAIEYEQFEQGSDTGGQGAEADLSRLADIPMELSVEIGRTHMTVGETLDLRPGAVVMLERIAGEAADLLVNGTPIARGEVVVVDEQYGLRVTEILDATQLDPGSEPGKADAGESASAEEASAEDTAAAAAASQKG
jgi:flagellar motor switch protein FliN